MPIALKIKTPASAGVFYLNHGMSFLFQLDFELGKPG